jgi:ribonucleoside-diphosphate reductase beta chain
MRQSPERDGTLPHRQDTPPRAHVIIRPVRETHPVRDGYTTTSAGLRFDSYPMRLYEKAKRLGVWNPSEIDFTQDQEDWQKLDEVRRTAILRLTSRFMAGEEAVTLDLLPLLMAVARDGRLEEELYLTTFLFEEGKHTQFFSRWLDEVTGSPAGVANPPRAYRRLFDDELPRSMHRLLDDPSPEALARASVTYNMVIEGVLAETGYNNYHQSLAVNGLMPGLCEGLVHVKRDESRHIAFGVYLLSRLVAEDPSIWPVIDERMNELLPLATDIVSSGYDQYPDGVSPFGLSREEAVEFMLRQFRKRHERISKARDRTLAEIDAAPEPDEVSNLVADV